LILFTKIDFWQIARTFLKTAWQNECRNGTTRYL